MIRSVRLPAGSRTDGDLHRALRQWQVEVVSLGAVDPTTTEMVRLRCARHHDCHT
jgi:hypothetical protein